GDVERVTQSRHLVRHADVDRPKRVFEQLRRLRNSRRTDGINVVNDLRIKMRGDDGRVRRYASDNLRNVVREKLRIARVNTLRRKREHEIIVEFQTTFLKLRQQHFVSRSRISRRLEDDQLTATQTLRDLFRGRENVRDVRLLRFA